MKLKRMLAPMLFLAAWLVYISSLVGTSWKMVDQEVPLFGWATRPPALELDATGDEPIRRLLVDLFPRGPDGEQTDPAMQDCIYRRSQHRVEEVPLHFVQQGPWRVEYVRYTREEHTLESYREGDLLVIRRRPLTSLRACEDWYPTASVQALFVPASITHVQGVRANLVVAATGPAGLEELTLDADAITIRAHKRVNTPFEPVRIGRLNLSHHGQARPESHSSDANEGETQRQARSYAVKNGVIDQLHIVADSLDYIELLHADQIRHIHLSAPPSVELHLGRADILNRIQWDWLEEHLGGRTGSLGLDRED